MTAALQDMTQPQAISHQLNWLKRKSAHYEEPIRLLIQPEHRPRPRHWRQQPARRQPGPGLGATRYCKRIGQLADKIVIKADKLNGDRCKITARGGVRLLLDRIV